MEQNLMVTGYKTPRGQLALPQLYFVAIDDWIPHIGEKAYIKWQQLYAMADRSDKEREYDKVPRSIAALCEHWKISKKTLYNQIIKPLWNYGFIDLVEYEREPGSSSKTQKPINIIVYPAPRIDKANLTQPLIKIRDYDTDYISGAKLNALKKNNPVPKEDGIQDPVSIGNGTNDAENDASENGNVDFNTVSIGNGPPFPQETDPRFHRVQNNYFKSFINSFKSLNKEEEEQKHARAKYLYELFLKLEIQQHVIGPLIDSLEEIKALEIITERHIKQGLKKAHKAAEKEHIGDPVKFLAKYIATEAVNEQMRLQAKTEKERAQQKPKLTRPKYNWLES